MNVLQGSPVIPGDKSISHRALIFGALAKGQTKIRGLLRSEDVHSTLNGLKAMGVSIEDNGEEVIVHGQGLGGLKSPSKAINCGNSGTTMRLFMGILAAQNFSSILIGDRSLSKRPMNRVAIPLKQMGGHISLTESNHAPVQIHPASLHAIDYRLEIASAQVKSAIMLAALFCRGTTRLSGLTQSRDHTERMLQLFGVTIGVTDEQVISIEGGQELSGCNIDVPGDPSTAAFLIAAACLVPGSNIELKNVSLNPTRLGFIGALRSMGAQIKIVPTNEGPEPSGTITASYSQLQSIHLHEQAIPALIDEIPILAVVCSQANGISEIRGASELRVKESDRLEAIAQNLKSMGAQIDVFSDGFKIRGPQKLKGALIQSHDDHRIAMAFHIAGLVAQGNTQIDHPECVNISYPQFYDTLRDLCL
ncbi:MAG: 3-phosphoshikimate 1-carboxyvinyltransferase [Myxococcota bacterium]